jgi:glutamyl-Q tRNA(Asp) synthetase
MGLQTERLADTTGDFVIRRADGLPAYQLAVVVDDAAQRVTEVVRGADLIDSTARQIHLQRLLGLPAPHYLHVPLVKDEKGDKLSKRLASDPIRQLAPERVVRRALQFLGQMPPSGLGIEALWRWAVEHWNIEAIRQSQVR